MELIEALQPDSPYVFYSDDHGFCINTADVMDILTTNKGSMIYRKEAIDAMCDACSDWCDEGVCKKVSVIQKLPSARDARKIGKWVRNDNGTYSCNVCQSWIPEEQHHYARYCLYCGAIMKGNNNGTV